METATGNHSINDPLGHHCFQNVENGGAVSSYVVIKRMSMVRRNWRSTNPWVEAKKKKRCLNTDGVFEYGWSSKEKRKEESQKIMDGLY